MNRWLRWLDRLREFNATQIELQERLVLLNRPWEEEFAHWAHDGHDWQLHGHRPPPADGRRHSVTSRGWCLGLQAFSGSERPGGPGFGDAEARRATLTNGQPQARRSAGGDRTRSAVPRASCLAWTFEPTPARCSASPPRAIHARWLAHRPQ